MSVEGETGRTVVTSRRSQERRSPLALIGGGWTKEGFSLDGFPSVTDPKDLSSVWGLGLVRFDFASTYYLTLTVGQQIVVSRSERVKTEGRNGTRVEDNR